MAERSEADDTLPLWAFLQVVWKRLWVIVMVTVLVTGAAVGFGLIQTPVYKASALILIGQKQAAGDPYSLAGDVSGLQQLTQTLAEAANSRTITERVVQKADLAVSPGGLQENLQVQPVPETQFIEVTYEDTDPGRAQLVANSIGEVFSERISEISPEVSGVTATLWEPAAVPQSPVSPNFRLLVPIALVLGSMLGLALAVLLDYLDVSWRSPEEVEQASGLTVVGFVPAFNGSKRNKRKSKKGIN